MKEITGRTKLAHRAGSLLALVGFFAYMAGLFGPVRMILFVGIALMLLSFAAFFIEEFTGRD